MPRTDDLHKVPEGLPQPGNDGACDHLLRMTMPPIFLPSTSGKSVSLADASCENRVIVYCYPRTGTPNTTLPPGWNDIPGARGCTPESCAFRDHWQELQALQADVFGLSTQTTEYQQEMVERLHLPFAILSDADLALTQSLRLPTFAEAGMVLIKRLTLVLTQSKVEHVFYPIFPPDKHAEEVIAWLKKVN